MGQQYNKVQKRIRRHRYLERKKIRERVLIAEKKAARAKS
jgi:hypothetical protein